ncbi:MAG: ABC transporter substrate-binding protein [Candidatus Paracaedimonas acanthamoebae]|uniref:ABC transporter substrate-binding protein n=1 Tax=Candidatus Paracaedimonas acanthamoebae TaxID=244581 RepID=A0A8J7Q0S9_9PROT|nr:ABC transporter substrate-binding protein [Candidatus Paracaedimonas acanthamoebae]
MKILKILLGLSVLILGSLFLFRDKIEPSAQSLKVIAISQIVEHPSLEAVRQGIYDFLSQSGLEEGKDYKVIYKNAQGNMSINNQIAQQLSGMKPDVMVAISTPSAQALASVSHGKNIPLVFAAVTDPLQARLIKDLNKPGDFISGVSDLPPLNAQIELIRELFPTAKKIGILYNPAEVNSTKTISEFQDLAKKFEYEILLAPTTKSSEVLFSAQNLIGKVDILYIPQDNTVVSAISSLISLQYEKKIPCFTSDEVLVQKGAIAAVGTSYYEHGKQVGEIVFKFLENKKGVQIPIAFPRNPQIYINYETAKNLDLSIPDKIAQKAKIYKLEK